MKQHFTRKELIDHKKQLQLSELQKEILVGTLLGDSSMSLRRGLPTYNVKFEQGEKNKQYIDHLYEIFQPFTGSPPHFRFIDKDKTRQAYWLRTFKHDLFIFYYNLFYRSTVVSETEVAQVIASDNREVVQESVVLTSSLSYKKIVKVKKIVPENIHKFLTPRALAYWFMDDGWRQVDQKKQTQSYYYHTQGFEKHEVKSLCDALLLNFGLSCKAHKDKDRWKLFIAKPCCSDFRNLIEPYIVSCFDYKL